MRYLRYTYVDAVTGISATAGTPRDAPRPPDVAGLMYLWALETEYPTEAPTFYGRAPDDTDLTVPGVLAEVTVAECLAAGQREWRARATEAFRRSRDAGLDVETGGGPLHVETDDPALGQIRALRDLLVDTGGTQAFVTRAGARVVADAAMMTTIHGAVAARWQALLAREAALYDAIDACTAPADLRAIDTAAGWP
ncbi:hypothetical protein [Roseospira visakhapatnamensis]|uniref:DUF4376 domain-containing protein n=1 Tax=Roseospira visakhapatnamensis TaxID=390880 RepID=A0A7W6WBD9_9PROT|nr:hypothetical protein [Roseospira visakhapatnamensis]MBB4267738.1 hypothetical protein [Roseospira visakhapatnamensis]